MSGTGLLSRDCPAKINLFLEVLSRREDGYHEIDTVLQTVGLFDTLFAREGPEGVRLRVEGADLPTDEGNLVVRAANRLAQIGGTGKGVDLVLVKRIPIQAGLGDPELFHEYRSLIRFQLAKLHLYLCRQGRDERVLMGVAGTDPLYQCG